MISFRQELEIVWVQGIAHWRSYSKKSGCSLMLDGSQEKGDVQGHKFRQQFMMQ